jgi:lipopolysaccharide transport system permease protein
MAGLATADYSGRQLRSVRVRALHWLLVALACATAVAVALPSLLTQPPYYLSTATVQFDPAAFPELLDAQGRPTPALDEQMQNLGEVLRLTRFPELRQRGLAFESPAPNTIVVKGQALDADRASAIAQAAAENLTRRLYAINGLPILRDVLGYADRASFERRPFAGEEDRLLTMLLETKAIDGVAPQSGAPSLAALTPSQRDAVTRALEVRFDQIEADLQNAIRIQRTSRDAAELAQAREQQRGAEAARRAVLSCLTYIEATYNNSFDVYTQSAAAFAARATPATLIPTYVTLKLLIAAFVGLAGGLLTVLIDRQVGILAKLQELWSYRELMRNMIVRDLKARYKNSALGYIWSLLNPLLMMLVFWIVFSLLLGSAIPMFPVFLIVALLPWNFAVTAVSGGMRSILDNANLVKKVYFPRDLLPITVVLSNLINYLLALPVMFLVMAVVQWSTLGHLNFSWSFAFLPVIILIQTIFLIGMALLLSTSAIFFRDTTHLVDIFIQLWFFLTPVFFALEQIATPVQAKIVRWLNPMASIIDFYRDILYGQATNPTPGLPALDGVFRTLLTALLVLAIGAYVFHRNSGRFGEEI